MSVASEEPYQAEDAFFPALLNADGAALNELLTEDFLIVDVMRGDMAGRAGFIAAVADKQVVFHQVQVMDRQARRYGDAAVVVGRSQMSGAFGDAKFTVASRYTHVFTRTSPGGWKLASAQGTQITG